MATKNVVFSIRLCRDKKNSDDIRFFLLHSIPRDMN